MSLDISLFEDQPVEVCDMNITHNVAPMWKAAGCYDALYNSQGKQARDILPALLNALDNMKKDQKKYEAMNPVNGWGSFDSAVHWLEVFYEKCLEYPDAKVRVSK